MYKPPRTLSMKRGESHIEGDDKMWHVSVHSWWQEVSVQDSHECEHGSGMQYLLPIWIERSQWLLTATPFRVSVHMHVREYYTCVLRGTTLRVRRGEQGCRAAQRALKLEAWAIRWAKELYVSKRGRDSSPHHFAIRVIEDKCTRATTTSSTILLFRENLHQRKFSVPTISVTHTV